MRKVDKRNIEDIFALTPMQQGMLFHYLKNPERDHYVEQLCLEIPGEINFQHFVQAWNVVIRTNEMLRAVFRWEMVENPVQMVLKEHRLKPKYFDFSKKRPGEKQELREDIKTRDRKETADLGHVPFRVTLCKMDENFYEMVVTNHHMLYDGWSGGIILKEFLEAYNQLFLKNKPIPPVKNKFKEFVKWIQNRDFQAEERYWKEYLNNFDSETDISLKRKAGDVINETGSVLFPFFPGKKDMLESFVRTHKITLASLLYGAWGILLQKINDSSDVMFGTTVSGRSANVKGMESIVGLFINTIPLRVQTHGNGDPDETIKSLVYRINDTLKLREPYESTPLVKIKEWIGVTNEALFDSIVVVENYPLYVDPDTLLNKKNEGLSIDSYSMFEMTHYDLAVGISIFPGIEVRFVYNKGSFDEQAVTTLRNGFTAIVTDIINNPGKEISRVEIIPGDEKKRILFDFNDTRSDYPAEKTILTLFETQVERNGNKIAVLYEDEQLSYHELNRRATQPGRLLRKKGVTPDAIVGLAAERSIEMMVGIFGILKAGGAYLPIDPDYPEERTRYMLTDTGAEILLTTRILSEKITIKKEIIYLENYKTLHAPCPMLHASQPGSSSLAYIIYTSGSTGNPKGVMIEHSQLVNFIYHMYNGYNRDFDCHDRCLSLTNITFDVCVCELFLPLAFGSCIVIVSEEKKSSVNDLAETIRDKGITFVYIPPGLLNELNSELKPYASKLKLNKMLVGVEPIRDDVLEDYLALNESMVILNGYGPTETTICSTTYQYRSHEPEGKIVPIGRPLSNTKIFILDRKDCLVPIGVPGEICISGDGEGRGYLNNPDLTAETFVDHPFETGKRMYRTGDRGKWLPEGNIQFLGRMDNQVKIRGYRVELGEIENQLLRYKGIKKTVVTAREDKKGEKYLCAYVVPGSLSPEAADSPDSNPSMRSISLNISGLRDFVSNRLPHYMIPSYFMQIEEIPLTPNGKIDRSALPSPGIKAGKEYAAPRNEIEEKLAALWSEVLEIQKETIGIDANFFDLGGHSLKATILLNRIHKALHVKIPLTEIFKTPFIRGLSGYIKQVARDRLAAVEPAPPAEYYPLSSSQKRNYILWQMEKKNMNYNMSEAIILEGRLDINRFETTFLKLIRRHESFRTSFEIINGEPVQKIHDEVGFRIEYRALLGNQVEVEGGNPHSPDSFHHLIKGFIRPFDLSKPPILRVGLLKLEDLKHLLILDMHHIIADGTSVGIFINDFMALSSGKTLPPLRVQPKDFARWQNQQKPNDSLKQQEAYWLKEIANEPPRLNMPLDFKRPSRQSFEGRILPFEISKEAADALKELAKETDVTLFMLLLAVINVWLWKLSGSETIVVGSPIANRRHADLEGVIGQFVNTLALKNRPGGEKSFTDFLKEVAQKTLGAYENQEYPFEDLVEQVVNRREPGRQPIFDVMFALHNMDIGDITIPGLTLTIFGYDPDIAQFDLYLVAYEREDRLAFKVGYCTRLFKQETIKTFVRYFQEIIDTVIDHKEVRLKAIKLSHHLLEPDARILREADGEFLF
jgi:tyrocidine synthetase-3